MSFRKKKAVRFELWTQTHFFGPQKTERSITSHVLKGLEEASTRAWSLRDGLYFEKSHSLVEIETIPGGVEAGVFQITKEGSTGDFATKRGRLVYQGPRLSLSSERPIQTEEVVSIERNFSHIEITSEWAELWLIEATGVSMYLVLRRELPVIGGLLPKRFEGRLTYQRAHLELQHSQINRENGSTSLRFADSGREVQVEFKLPKEVRRSLLLRKQGIAQLECMILPEWSLTMTVRERPTGSLIIDQGSTICQRWVFN